MTDSDVVVAVHKSKLQAVGGAIRTALGVQTQYELDDMPAAIGSIGGATVEALSVTQNGTYTAPSGKAYSPVTVNVAGGGSVALLTQSEWDALTSAQKQAYGLVAIQRANTGYNRGILVDGASYIPYALYNTGTGASSASFVIAAAGTYSLYVIALNSEASTYQLSLSASQNNTPLTVDYSVTHAYESSGSNRRNYRISKYDFTAAANDAIDIALSNSGGYSAFVYAVVQGMYSALDMVLSSADSAISGSNGTDGMVIYGTFDGQEHSGTISVAEYTAGTTISPDNPGTNYKSAYIAWFK